MLNGDRSCPPHETLSAWRTAIDELLAVGAITEQPYNDDHGVVEFKGTKLAAKIARPLFEAFLRGALGE
jgi:hypothetical protein